MIFLPKSIPKEYQAEMLKTLTDPIKFMGMLSIQDKATNKMVKFKLNSEQKKLVKALSKSKRIIVLKPRQIGISTLLRAYAFWSAYVSTEPVSWGVISFHDRSAKHLRRMDDKFHLSLPTLLHRQFAIQNTIDLEFKESGARLSSYTAGGKGGTRSFTLTSAHLSEFAFYDDPDELLATVMATVGEGQVIIESTPHQAGDAFHRLVTGAPDNGWELCCFWWWQHKTYYAKPPKDFEMSVEEDTLAKLYDLSDGQVLWRRRQILTLGLEKFRREYPACLDDAFHFTMSTYFHPDDLAKITGVFFDGSERLYEEAIPNDSYVLGADVAAGVGLDYSTITIVSLSSLQPVYQWRSNTVIPVMFAEKILTVANEYNMAMVLCESNNHGHVVLTRLKDFRYRRMWCDHNGKDWVTTVKSKLDAYETLREYIVSEIIETLDMTTLMELRSLTVQKVTPEAPSGMHDDMAMSIALAYRCTRDVPRRVLNRAQENVVDGFIRNRRVGRRKDNPIPWERNR